MFCTQCGHQLPDGAKFCTNCGAAVDYEVQPREEEPAQSAPETSVPNVEVPVEDAPAAATPAADDAAATPVETVELPVASSVPEPPCPPLPFLRHPSRKFPRLSTRKPGSRFPRSRLLASARCRPPRSPVPSLRTSAPMHRSSSASSPRSRWWARSVHSRSSAWACSMHRRRAHSREVRRFARRARFHRDPERHGQNAR